MSRTLAARAYLEMLDAFMQMTADASEEQLAAARRRMRMAEADRDAHAERGYGGREHWPANYRTDRS